MNVISSFLLSSLGIFWNYLYLSNKSVYCDKIRLTNFGIIPGSVLAALRNIKFTKLNKIIAAIGWIKECKVSIKYYHWINRNNETYFVGIHINKQNGKRIYQNESHKKK